MTAPDSNLHRWKLPRGRHGLSAEVVTRSQRERLLAAVVQVSAEQTYTGTSVAEILKAAGVGRELLQGTSRTRRPASLRRSTS